MAKVVAADGKVYDKSSTANATVAPTNEATIQKAQDTHLNPKVLEFVTIIDYEWNLNGNIDPDSIQSEYGYTKDEYVALCNDPTAIATLNERGVLPQHYYVAVGDYELPAIKTKISPIQLKAANALLDLTDTRSNKKKLQDLGIKSTQYNAWLRDPEFTKYLQMRAESLIGDSQHEALLALMDKVQARDIKAIELYLELTGRFVKQTSTNSNDVGNLQNIIVKIVEIITEEVHDRETAFRISERLKGLVAGAQVAGIVSAPTEIVKPEIATAREITPEVKALMDKGVGYDG